MLYETRELDFLRSLQYSIDSIIEKVDTEEDFGIGQMIAKLCNLRRQIEFHKRKIKDGKCSSSLDDLR